jgi:lipopolysaccharide biosynthesis glycosyltransferase
MKDSTTKIYIGYDSRHPIASEVCEYSLRKHSKDLDIEHLKLSEVDKNLYWREYKNQSTEFTYTRFLVPYLQDYEGWALFCDNDFLFLDDVKKIFDMRDDKYALMCCQHDYYPETIVKMVNKKQTMYKRKCWSSLMLINCGHESVKKLDLSTVSEQSGKYLHQFKWLKDEEIGSIPRHWNWLVNWYKESDEDKPSALHFTEGGPWIVESEYKNLWLDYKKQKENLR